MKLKSICFWIFTAIVGNIYFVYSQENDCKCWVARKQRVACLTGAFLSEDSCRDAGCCFALPPIFSLPGQEIDNSPGCFRPLRSCHPVKQCNIDPYTRKPCSRVSRPSDKRLCQFRGCCFDASHEPFCYRAESRGPTLPTIVFTTTEPTPARDTSLKVIDGPPPEPLFDVLKRQMNDYEKSVAFEESYGTLDSGEIVSIQCAFSSIATPCGPSTITKLQCVNKGCCWNPKLAKASYSKNCIQPNLEPVGKVGAKHKPDIGRETVKESNEKEREEKERILKEKRERLQEKEENKGLMEKKQPPVEESKDEIISNGIGGVFIKTCSTVDKRKKCPGKISNRAECILNSCCWDSLAHTEGPNACYVPTLLYHPQLNTNRSDDSTVEWIPINLEDLQTNSQNPHDIVDGKFLTTSISPVTEFVYTDFSVILTCPDVSGNTELCKGGNTRQQCLSLFCCWVSVENSRDHLCAKPSISFSETPRDTEVFPLSDLYPIDDMTKPDFWRPSLPQNNLLKNNEDMVTISCPSINTTASKLVPCGAVDIFNRETCVNHGCCWRPWLILEGRNFPACHAPEAKLDNIATFLAPEYSIDLGENSESFWSPWAEWSSCKSKFPCSAEGQQHRDRYCSNLARQHLVAASDVTKCPGAAFEVRTCYNITGCDATFWSPWSPWTSCSESCQSGNSIRSRTCLVPDGCPIDFNSEPGTEIDRRVCNTEMCAEWGPWIANDDCDADCERSGTSTKFRTCRRFATEEGRFSIIEKITILKRRHFDLRSLVPSQPEVFSVHADECIVQRVPCRNSDTCRYEWDDWSSWGDCSSPCGLGKRQRLRRCLQTAPNRPPKVAANSSCDAVVRGSAVEETICGDTRCQSWSKWEVKSGCNAGCEERGILIKERNCNSDEFDVGAQPSYCFRTEEKCRGPPCPLTTWESWGSWSSHCVYLCTPGIETRARRCIMRQDSSWLDSSECEGPHIDVRACNPTYCSVWGNWTEGDCEASCGGRGVKRSHRVCLDEIFANDTPNSLKKSTNLYASDMPLACYTTTKPCNRRCDIKWEEWGSWSICSATCTSGSRKRFRRCLRDDGTLFNNRFCSPDGEESDSQTELCNVNMCTKWNSWVKGRCVGRCKERGVQIGVRTCADRDEQWLDTTYPGKSAKCYRRTFSCTAPCAKWGKWGNFTECSDPCGPGRKSRYRLCMRGNDVVPRDECKPIRGRVFEEKNCNIFHCKSYSDWKYDFFCEGNCGQENATKIRKRECRSGKAPPECLTQRFPCRPRCGPGWGPWSEWSECTEKCGPGHHERTRKCLNGDEILDPKICMDVEKNDTKGIKEREECNQDFCLNWSKWQSTICPAKCKQEGVQRRNRICLGPSSPLIPLDCWSDLQTCKGKCKATWGQWTSWTRCTTDCGPGKQTSVRRCTQNGQVVNPKLCEKNKKPQTLRTRGCYTMMCDNWSKWVSGPCTVICGGSGSATRTRKCLGTGLIFRPDNPSDQSCFKREKQCGTNPCPNFYEAWSEWSLCSSICSPGKQQRTRKCVTNGFDFGDCNSLGPAVESRPCNTRMCKKWKAWRFASPCTGQCGGTGDRLRQRSCFDRQITDGKMKSLHQESCYLSRVSCQSSPC